MRQPPDELMLFAAGFGSRMQPLTVDLPKPLIPVAGKSLLDRTLSLATAGGITKTVVNTHYLGNKIANHLKNCPAQVVHEPNILDTGGGLKNASKFFEGPAIFHRGQYFRVCRCRTIAPDRGTRAECFLPLIHPK